MIPYIKFTASSVLAVSTATGYWSTLNPNLLKDYGFDLNLDRVISFKTKDTGSALSKCIHYKLNGTCYTLRELKWLAERIKELVLDQKC